MALIIYLQFPDKQISQSHYKNNFGGRLELTL
uniref:Uncharacterized protein n=1 Tax=Rhizophora mucronata TaxID=61149 RepID=A0A2P2QML9_RHIMU